MRGVFLFLLFILPAVSAASARDVTDAEKAELGSEIDRFDAALTQSDFKSVSNTIPPKVLDAIASKAGITRKQLNAALTTQMQMALASVKLTEFEMDRDATEYSQTADGTPYALVPTRTLIEAQGKKMETRSYTLGLIDGERWYLLRVNDAQQLLILREVYPAFAKVEFPNGSTKVVE